jgi:hypothetical protein
MTNTDDILARIFQVLADDDDPHGDLDDRLGDDYDDEIPLAPLPMERVQRASLIRAIDAGLHVRGCDNRCEQRRRGPRRRRCPGRGSVSCSKSVAASATARCC